MSAGETGDTQALEAVQQILSYDTTTPSLAAQGMGWSGGGWGWAYHTSGAVAARAGRAFIDVGLALTAAVTGNAHTAEGVDTIDASAAVLARLHVWVCVQTRVSIREWHQTINTVEKRRHIPKRRIH